MGNLFECGVGTPNLQSKTVSPSTSAQTVKPDSNYDGLLQVTINAAPLQAKTVSPSTSAQTVKPDSGKYGLSQVSVGAAPLQYKNFTPNGQPQEILPDAGYYGLSGVWVYAHPILVTPDTITLNPSITYKTNVSTVVNITNTFSFYTANYTKVISSDMNTLPAGTALTSNIVMSVNFPTISSSVSANKAETKTYTIVLGKG